MLLILVVVGRWDFLTEVEVDNENWRSRPVSELDDEEICPVIMRLQWSGHKEEWSSSNNMRRSPASSTLFNFCSELSNFR